MWILPKLMARSRRRAAPQRSLTNEIMSTLATNHRGHFVLTINVSPLLKTAAEVPDFDVWVVNVSEMWAIDPNVVPWLIPSSTFRSFLVLTLWRPPSRIYRILPNSTSQKERACSTALSDTAGSISRMRATSATH